MLRVAPLFAILTLASCGHSSSKGSPPPIDPESLSYDEALEMAVSSAPHQRTAAIAALELRGAAAREQLTATARDQTADTGTRCKALRALAALAHEAQATRSLATELAAEAPLSECAKLAVRRLDGNAALTFERVVVLGASLSAGFGGAPVGELLDKLLDCEHEIQSLADTFFYVSPFEKARDQIQRAAAQRPQVVFALDSLFWFVYVPASAEQRMARLERGLQLLEPLSAPLLLGDIPHMRDAHPMMLAPEAIPPAEQLEQFNLRIRDWARSRVNVVVVPLSDWVAPLLRGEDVVVEPGRDPEPSTALMTFDKLHPNEAGVRYILRKLDAAIEGHFPETDPDALRVP